MPYNSSAQKGGTFFIGRKKMRTITQHRVEAITGDTPQEAAMLFNEAMDRLAGLNPTFEREGSTFWIHYKIVHEEAESISERYELAGKAAHCIECPYVIRDLNRFGNVDTRKKWATCGKTGVRMSIRSRACDTFYESFGEGGIQLEE